MLLDHIQRSKYYLGTRLKIKGKIRVGHIQRYVCTLRTIIILKKRAKTGTDIYLHI